MIDISTLLLSVHKFSRSFAHLKFIDTHDRTSSINISTFIEIYSCNEHVFLDILSTIYIFHVDSKLIFV